MKKSISILIVLFIFAYIVAHFLFQYKDVASSKDIELYYQQTKDNSIRLKEYKQLFNKNHEDIDVIYGYFHTLCDNDFLSKKVVKETNRVLDIYRERYKKNKEDSIANFALGTYNFFKNNNERANKYFEKIETKQIKYLNLMMGEISIFEDEYELAETHFLNEIAQGGELNEAYFQLARLYESYDETEKLKELFEDNKAVYYLSQNQSISIDYFYENSQYIRLYIWSIFHAFTQTDFWGIIGALTIAFLWIFYLNRLDIYEPEKKKSIFLCWVLGFLCAGLVTFYNYYWHVNISLQEVEGGNYFNNFLYNTLAVGVIEELVKFLPFLYFFYITRCINESFDFILYPSLAAIGFACIENMMYFNYSSNSTMILRGLFCCSSHAFSASIIGYGCMKSYLALGKLSSNYIFKYFALACIEHGLYDTFIGESVWLDSAIWFGEIAAWMYLINHGLKNSKFYSSEKIHNAQRLQKFLFLGFGCLLIYEFLVNAYKFGGNFRENDLFLGVLPKFLMCLAVSYLLSRVTSATQKKQESFIKNSENNESKY